MDISDDIAYSVHDIEDGVQTGELDPATLGENKSLELVFETTVTWYGMPRAMSFKTPGNGFVPCPSG